MLTRLVYVSTADKALSRAELEAIHKTAQARNARLGITGLLVYTGTHFMQLLEGERDAVEAVFDAILADPRHSGLVRLIAEPSLTRACPDWAMAMRMVPEPAADSRAVFQLEADDLEEFLPATMPADLRLLFTSFNSMRWAGPDAAKPQSATVSQGAG